MLKPQSLHLVHTPVGQLSDDSDLAQPDSRLLGLPMSQRAARQSRIIQLVHLECDILSSLAWPSPHKRLTQAYSRGDV